MTVRFRHELSLTKREVAALISALNYARNQTVNPSWRWWEETGYVRELRAKLRASLDAEYEAAEVHRLIGELGAPDA